MLAVGDIIRERNVSFHIYADDTQLYISAEPNDAATIKINEDKTEISLVGPKTKRELLLNNLGKSTPWIKSEVTKS